MYASQALQDRIVHMMGCSLSISYYIHYVIKLKSRNRFEELDLNYKDSSKTNHNLKLKPRILTADMDLVFMKI